MKGPNPLKRPEITQQITFLHAENLSASREFYSDWLGLTLVRDQSTCLIFKVTDQAYLGFCEHIEPITPGRKVILTLVSDDVDGWYELLKTKTDNIIQPPQANSTYQIYHFFIKDPDGYWVEIQRFDNPL